MTNCKACGKSAKKTVRAFVVTGPGDGENGDVCGGCAALGVLIVQGDDRPSETMHQIGEQKPTGLPKLRKEGFGIREAEKSRAKPASAPERAQNGEGALRMLAHIAQNGALTRSQVSLFTGYKKDQRNKYLRGLEDDGLVTLDVDTFVATPQGREIASDITVPKRGQQLRAWWIDRLSEGELRVFYLFTQRTDVRVWLSRDEVGTGSGYQKDQRNKYLRKLLGHGVIVEDGKGFRGAEELFG